MMNEVAAHELDLDREHLDTSDLVALVQADKSWGHQFVDNHQSLRGLFEKVYCIYRIHFTITNYAHI